MQSFRKIKQISKCHKTLSQKCLFSRYTTLSRAKIDSQHREIDQECFPFRLKQMIEQYYVTQIYKNAFSVTEGELFLVCDLLSEKDREVKLFLGI